MQVEKTCVTTDDLFTPAALGPLGAAKDARVSCLPNYIANHH